MELRTINIKGKEYVQVSERVRAFHDIHPNGSITTEYWLHDKTWVVKATVTDGKRTFTGLSQAVAGVGMMGAVALENAETSAVGRALGFLGIGVIDGIASADEMAKAPPAAQKQPQEARKPATPTPAPSKAVKTIQAQIMHELVKLEPRIGKLTDAVQKKQECEATVAFYCNGLKLVAENFETILEKLKAANNG